MEYTIEYTIELGLSAREKTIQTNLIEKLVNILNFITFLIIIPNLKHH